KKKNADGSWAIDMAPLGMGFGNFPQVMQLLKDMAFGGPISFHCEYHYMPPESVVDQLRIDTRFIQAIVDELE
ncbi:MAG TPA: hypothetical protein QGH10_15715, partial [Armatimonadota bacterium]|nr:hypothetical protein [Armatimonadota bacterium]